MKSRIANISILACSLTLTFLLAEAAFRWLLFSDIPSLQKLRLPDLYADHLADDDYFKLRYLFPGSGEMSQGRPPHPLLGWVGDLPPDTLLHNESEEINSRRPVLLYGDSFAGCVTSGILCFDDILNNDDDFSQSHYLLNYGIPGYGVDQIHLLLKNSVDLYDAPFVVVSFMTLDLDRTVLKFRGLPKPYFEINEGQLQLQGIPISQTREEYITENPPQIRSYLYRRVLHSGRFPSQLRSWLTGEAELTKVKQTLGEAILLQIVAELEARDLDYVFLIFHPHYPGISVLANENDWRDPWLKQNLDENNIPYIWSKEIYRSHVGNNGPDFARFIIPNDGHPTTYFNKLISQEIKQVILNHRG